MALMKKLIIIFLVSFTYYNNLYAQSLHLSEFSKDIKGKLSSGQSYRLVLTQVQYKPKNPDEKYQCYWGTDGEIPLFVIQEFTLEIGGEQVVDKKSLYSDLCNLTYVNLIEDGKSVHIEIKGGDGAGSFKGKYTFTGTESVQREIFYGECHLRSEKIFLSRGEDCFTSTKEKIS
jgi:hypothetical protein